MPIDCGPEPVWMVRTRGNAPFPPRTEHPIRLGTIRTRLYNKFNHFPYTRYRYSDSLRAGRSGDRIPVGVRFTAPVQTGTGAHPASYTMDTGSFQGVKWPGRGVDHPPHRAKRLKEVPLLHIWVFVACYRANFVVLPLRYLKLKLNLNQIMQ